MLIAITGATYYFHPEIAGYVGAAFWAVFVLVPSMLVGYATRLSLQQRFNEASRLMTISALLHPFDGYWQQPKFFRAMDLAHRLGEVDLAVAILQQLQNSHIRIARTAKIHLCRLTGDWTGLAEWITTTIPSKRLLRDPTLLPMCIRALGETGQLSQMLKMADASALSAHPQMSAIRGLCRLNVFAFCGQPRRVSDVLGSTLWSLPEDTKQVWLATAELAGGMIDTGMNRLASTQPTASPGLVRSIEHRRAAPPLLAETILTDQDREILHRLDREHDQEQRFSPTFSRRRLPWVTYGLILANIILFGFEWIMGGTMDDEALLRLGAMVPDVFQSHEYYRLFMANFLHYGPVHIVMNMLGLLVIGPFVELNLGRLWYLALYLIAGVGTMATMAVVSTMHWTHFDFLVGASGAIMALIGATGGILLRGWYRERATMASRRLRLIIAIVLVQVLFDHFTPMVSGAAHLIGIAWGFVLASVLPHRRKRVNTE
jgi:rhomboid protease GluP